MIDASGRAAKEQQKEKVRQRMRVTVDPENYEYIPAKKPLDFYDSDVHQRVVIYVRVSTDDVRQTTSYELQQKYYEDFVKKHPNWELVKIYADEGISGTSLKHRDAFNEMIRDAKAGKFDFIVTKSVSRFARNVVICIGVVRDLAEMKQPVGVFFESECIFSMNDDSQMALTFLASMAEEESHIRSRSMDSSVRMRLDHGIPLTPKLLGYMHDEDGHLIVNPDESPTVKLIFYMYLYGYSCPQIATVLEKLEKRTYLGNYTWSPSVILQVLRNERHCGQVLTQKTITENYRTHRTLKNRGEKPQSRYLQHHEPIVTPDDFIAVQHMIDNAKYRNREILPKLHVIDEGLLKGYVVINPRWAAFDRDAYVLASESVTHKSNADDADEPVEEQETYSTTDGEFDLRGFEIVRTELMNIRRQPTIRVDTKRVKLSIACVDKVGERKAELLIHPGKHKLAVRPAPFDSRNAVSVSKLNNIYRVPREIPAAAFGATVFALFGWNKDMCYKITGSLFEKNAEYAYIFDAEECEILLPKEKCGILHQTHSSEELDAEERKSIVRALPENWADNFGREYYVHLRTFEQLENQSEEDWNLYITGQLFNYGKQLHVTEFSELQAYIRQELQGIKLEDDSNE